MTLFISKKTTLNFLLVVFLFFPLSIQAQSDYKSGFIITNTNDTISGYIDLKSNRKNSLQCRFKEKLSNNPVSVLYSPYDIQSYMVDNKFYVSKNVTIDEKEELVFLEYLVDGIVDLYYYKKGQYELYFIEKDSELYKLSNDEIEKINENGKTYIKKSNQYIGMLAYLFRESPSLSNKISKTDFKYKSLINITKEYHKNVCNEYECIVYSKSPKTKVFIEPNIGVVASQYGMSTSKDHDLDTKPIVGLHFTFNPPNVHYVWSFTTGVSYSKNSFSGDFTANFNQSAYENHFIIEMDYSIVRIPLIINYNFPTTKRIKPFINLGYNNVFILQPEHNIELKYNSFSPLHSEFRNYQFGFLFGTGMRYDISENSYLKFKCDYEYRLPGANLQDILDYQRVNSLHFNFIYGFKISK